MEEVTRAQQQQPDELLADVFTVPLSFQKVTVPSNSGFRIFLCPLLCKNGGVCVQKDRCLCPTNFTGKFCQIAVTTTTPTATTAPSSTNHIIKPAHLLSPGMVANQKLTQSEFLLPLRQDQEAERSRDSPSMVTVRVQHPPEASVKVHQVMKVSGFSPMLRVLTSRTHSGSAGAPAPAARGVQAQTLRGDVTYTQHSGFKYCFREVRNGQCSSPLPGLRSRDTCCRGIGKAWGITDCVLCPQNTGPDNSSCPVGFERGNGTQCVDVNECLQLRLCENGMCVNTRGSYSCVCRTGYILDATHGICISQSVISQEKSQCYRVLGPGQGPSSCSLPILRNITKQICCCSRVGKAWGPNCQRCPYFGSAAFKEICPAGPGYHYSASTLQFNQRVSQHLSRHGAPVVMQRVHGNEQSSLLHHAHSPDKFTACAADTERTHSFWDKPLTVGRPASQQNPPSQPRPVPSLTTQPRPQLSNGTHAAVWGVCHSTPGVCGRGQCVDQPGGKHTCVCDQGYQTNAQRTHCQDIDECRQNLCMNGLCENTPGSFRCLCHRGYRIQGNTCADVDECEDALLCPGQECVNSQGSYRCVSCHAGYTLINRLCTDIDECRHAPCSNGHCQNTPGSYHCVCRHGYKLQGNTCTDVDECLYPSQCPDQMCVNSVGSYHCVSCAPGYTLINRQCTDVNECEDRGSCPNQDCVNTEGSYRCVDCKKGFHTVDGVCTGTLNAEPFTTYIHYIFYVKHERVPGQVKHERDPGQMKHERDPGQVKHEHVPGQVKHERVPGQVKHERVPGQVKHERVPGQVKHERVPGQVKHERDPGQVKHERVPGQ
ncbi:LOW QUALITY PROTEIN: latent-transforming growth factor beta-binding protein 4-like, partial [Thalassophryne amazonica]|uniref:LOW QUALITY PROTEIN: latent-transforming growth factor beta-binding protein 4-like n=1 Tax=Thalassophryne amazonica TaxID=390379 RepID=UPI001470ABF9